MNQVANVEERQITPSQQFRNELDKMGDQFAAALPSHIKPEKFQRVVMTAVISDPDILRADRKSLMESAIRAAQDGLLPDKREGAFVVFNTKVKDENGKDKWIKAVQWMPMVGGIIKRIHQSGDIKMLTARVVYGGDHFRTWIDDTGEHVEYEPAEDQDTDVVRRVFAMATTVDGAVYVEPLSVKDVEKIRSVSRGKEKGPWADWWEEMAKKSAIRRLAKRLPLSVDLHDLIQRDNALFDLDREQTEAKPSLRDRLQAARNVTPELDDKREGFDRSFVQSETDSALTGEIMPDEQEPGDRLAGNADEQTLASSAEPADSAPLSAGSNIPDASEPDGGPASGSMETADGQSRQTPTSAVSGDQETEILIRYARDVLLMAAEPETTGAMLAAVEKQYAADDFTRLSKQSLEKAKAISRSMRAIFNNETSLDIALEFYAEALGCSVETLRGDDNG